MPYDESFEDLPRRAPKLQMDEIDLWAEDLFQDPELQDGLLTAADPMEFIYWYVSETALSLSKAEQSKVARRIYQMMRGEHTASVDGTHRTAETLGETYPDAYVYVHSSGVAFFCNVSIAWSGADPADAKRRIDEAALACRDVYNNDLSDDMRLKLSPWGIEINSTSWQGGADMGFGEVQAWQELLRERGIKVVDHDEWAREYR